MCWHFSDQAGSRENHHTPCPPAAPEWPWEVSKGDSVDSLPCRLGYSSLQGVWPNEGELPGHWRPWKSIEEVQQIVRELGMRQAIHAPVFEIPDPVTFTAGMKAKILQSSLVPVMGCWYPC